MLCEKKLDSSPSALKTSPVTASLPTLTSSFGGRDLELAEVTALLAKSECRLLSLIGLGGTGKSRLALKVAEQLGPSFQDGLAFISLYALTAVQLIPSAIADALKVSLHGHEDPHAGHEFYKGQTALAYLG